MAIGIVLWCLIPCAVTDRAAFLGMISVPASWASWLIVRDQRKERVLYTAMLSTLLVAAAAVLMATGYEDPQSREECEKVHYGNLSGNLGSEGDAVRLWQGWWYDEICRYEDVTPTTPESPEPRAEIVTPSPTPVPETADSSAVPESI